MTQRIFVREQEIGTLREQLKQAHDALDVAVYALIEYEDRDSYDCEGNWCGCEHSTAHKALTKITALFAVGSKADKALAEITTIEQKD